MVDDPYQITYIDPADVDYFSARARRSNRNRWKDVGRIMDGDWDVTSQSEEYAIENSSLYQAIEDRFTRGVSWEETEYVQQMLERLERGDRDGTWRAVVRSEGDLWERCRQLDTLYKRITEEGYKSKREVFSEGSNDPMGYYPRTFKYSLDEVMVDIGRQGEPLLVDGKHRLYIGKVYDVEEIPVLTVVRHRGHIDD